MGTHTVTTDVLYSPPAEAYFTRADRRVMIGLRAALEMLGLPTPDYARRKLAGPPPARDVIAAFHADNPALPSYNLPSRKPNATAPQRP